jgi:hypothetical protein
MASCATLIKDFFNNGLEPDLAEDGSKVTNMAHDVLRTGIVLTCLKPEKMKGQSESPGRKILEYMQSKGFSGFREGWQRLKEGRENMLVFAEDLI